MLVLATARLAAGAVLLLAAAASAAPASPDPAAECGNVSTRGGVRLCERPRASSNFSEFEASATVCTTGETLLEYLRDVPRLTDWFPYVEDAQLLAEEPGSHVQYIRNAAPWPFKSRHLAYRISYGQRGDTISLTIEGLPGYPVPEADAVPLEAASGGWRFEPRGSRTLVTFHMHVNPGGVPRMFVHRRTRATVRDAVRHLTRAFPCD